MRNTVSIFLMLSLINPGCHEEVTVSDLITEVNVSANEIKADGSSSVIITAKLNNDLDKKTVLFATTNGVFKESGDLNYSTEAKYNQADSLLALAELIAPTSLGDGKIVIETRLELGDLTNRYVKTNTIQLNPSEPSSISLEANSFSVENNYGSEIEIKGILKNSDGDGVSEGHMVKIVDYDEDFSRINGDFRNKDSISNSNSQISTFYSPGIITANQYLYLIATVYDLDSKVTNIKDTLRIYIKESE